MSVRLDSTPARSGAPLSFAYGYATYSAWRFR